MTSARELFWGNEAYLVRHRRRGVALAILAVPGGGLSYVQQVAYYSTRGAWIRKDAEVGRIVRDPQAGLMVDVAELPQVRDELPELRVVAVWRDPVDRFAEIYQRYCVEAQWHYPFQLADLRRHPDPRRLADYAGWELSKTDPLTQDHLIRRQSDLWSLELVDQVMTAEQFPAWVDAQHLNRRRLHAPARKTRPALDPQTIDTVRDLYADDYALWTQRRGGRAC